MNVLSILQKTKNLFENDYFLLNKEIKYLLRGSKILVIGGAGSIGKAVVKKIFQYDPKILNVVDISENNLVELVRDIRSSFKNNLCEFKTFAIDSGSLEFEFFFDNESINYDYVFNLSALKHVRNEKDPYTLMRMIDVNIFNMLNILRKKKYNFKNFFCVSTDKAVNSSNMMGASKKIMELFLIRESQRQRLSMSRFANVAFSDGSLLHGFNQRILKQQPLSAPSDVMRYFITEEESGIFCLISCLFAENRDIFFPKIDNELKLIKFSDIVERYLDQFGYSIQICDTEEEARNKTKELIKKKIWPCYFFKSDTSGEKSFEEFYLKNEKVDLKKFKSIGVVKNNLIFNEDDLNNFEDGIKKLKKVKIWNKTDILNLFYLVLKDFKHIETGKNLDQKM